MNEWKELKIDDLPSDIMKGRLLYDFMIYDESEEWAKSIADIIYIITAAKKHSRLFRYRKRQPKAPTHEEIMKSKLVIIETERKSFGLGSNEHVEAMSDGIEYLLSLTFAKLPEAL